MKLHTSTQLPLTVRTVHLCTQNGLQPQVDIYHHRAIKIEFDTPILDKKKKLVTIPIKSQTWTGNVVIQGTLRELKGFTENPEIAQITRELGMTSITYLSPWKGVSSLYRNHETNEFYEETPKK